MTRPHHPELMFAERGDDFIESRLEPHELQSVPEVALALGVDNKTVIAWIESGEIDAWQAGTTPDRNFWKPYRSSVVQFYMRRKSSALAGQRKGG